MRAFAAVLVLICIIEVALDRFNAWLWRKTALLLCRAAARSSRHAIDLSNAVTVPMRRSL